MTFGSIKVKVPNGKLLSVKVEYSDTIDTVQILGDFFVHPESAIGLIEGALLGIGISKSESEVAAVIAQAAGDAVMVGVSPEAMANAIKRVVSSHVEDNTA